MTDSSHLADRYAEVCNRIGEAAVRSGRRPEEIIVVAVSKYAEPDQIKALVDLGHRDFGENQVQQLVQREAVLAEYLDRLRVLSATRRSIAGDTLLPKAAAQGIRWHMIGHLQRNKARKVIDFVRLIHSVDSLRLAEELQQAALKRDQNIEVLIQVNCSGEASKFGCPVPAALPLAEQIDTMVNVRVRGVMTMAPLTERPEDVRPVFVRCREVFEEFRDAGVGDGQCNLLSMGMSGDYEIAIAEGANIVRIGSAIFGEQSAETREHEAGARAG
ncbi:MAG: YggS family pyridoxal phosphate-dependent enzyme [Phycisphaeraceae bacterium]|nr:YggS family pyridoxal phosphate-dependent enzyme [Phycisphaeraceae bacterium]MCW5755262.1 YggS family pyridoxal phosphate-dependent enzyme [Phycisphaeraceae bacterium]